jgi:hypothetical protein
MADATAADAPTEQAAPVKAPKPAKAPAKDAKAKGKAKGKGAKGGKGAAAPTGSGPNVAAHPRAARSIARAKGWGGLVGFLVAGYLSLPTSTFAWTIGRALIAGGVCYVACWGAAVFAWRRLVMLELKSREQKLVAELLAGQGSGAPGAAAGAPGAQAGARDAS